MFVETKKVEKPFRKNKIYNSKDKSLCGPIIHSIYIYIYIYMCVCVCVCVCVLVSLFSNESEIIYLHTVKSFLSIAV